MRTSAGRRESGSLLPHPDAHLGNGVLVFPGRFPDNELHIDRFSRQGEMGAERLFQTLKAADLAPVPGVASQPFLPRGKFRQPGIGRGQDKESSRIQAFMD
jgi:hypothetical protein